MGAVGWCLVLGMGALAWAQASPTDVRNDVKGAIRIEQQVQQKIEAWNEERSGVLADIRELKAQKKWLEYQHKKYDAYIREQDAAISELKRKQEEIEKIKTALEPYMAETVERLETFVHEDLPFLTEERERRLAFLRNSLYDYHLALGEKLRRVLEALHVEAEYGRTLEKSEATLELSGGPTRVVLFRVGRVGLFGMSLDGKNVVRLNAKTGEWEPLPAAFRAKLSLALDMADKRRAVELVDLPVGTWNP